MTESILNGIEENECEKETVSDKNLPLSFTEDRHLEAIEGVESVTQTWRMKERVSNPIEQFFLLNNIFLDENSECGSCVVLECRRRSTGCIKNAAMCSPRVLDWYVI